jgi:hypothetical protein
MVSYVRLLYESGVVICFSALEVAVARRQLPIILSVAAIQSGVLDARYWVLAFARMRCGGGPYAV